MPSAVAGSPLLLRGTEHTGLALLAAALPPFEFPRGGRGRRSFFQATGQKHVPQLRVAAEHPFAARVEASRAAPAADDAGLGAQRNTPFLAGQQNGCRRHWLIPRLLYRVDGTCAHELQGELEGEERALCLCSAEPHAVGLECAGEVLAGGDIGLLWSLTRYPATLH